MNILLVRMHFTRRAIECSQTNHSS